jgi:hypothetical protein
MIHKKPIFTKRASPPNDGAITGLVLISSFFFIGCVFGALVGTVNPKILTELGIPELLTISGTSIYEALALFFGFHVAALALGTSFLGLVTLPLLTTLNGFAVSCASATIISGNGSQGVVMALLIVGLPALFSVPCYFALSATAFNWSGRLARLARGDFSAAAPKKSSGLWFCLPVLAAGFIAELFLVPYLLSLVS